MQNNKTERRASSLLHTQTNVDENQNKENSSELRYRRQIDGTPFYIIGDEEKGYFLALGQFRLTEPEETPTAAMDLLITDQWNIILKLVVTSHQLVVNSIQEQANEQIIESTSENSELTKQNGERLKAEHEEWSQRKEHMTNDPWSDTKK